MERLPILSDFHAMPAIRKVRMWHSMAIRNGHLTVYSPLHMRLSHCSPPSLSADVGGEMNCDIERSMFHGSNYWALPDVINRSSTTVGSSLASRGPPATRPAVIWASGATVVGSSLLTHVTSSRNTSHVRLAPCSTQLNHGSVACVLGVPIHMRNDGTATSIAQQSATVSLCSIFLTSNRSILVDCGAQARCVGSRKGRISRALCR